MHSYINALISKCTHQQMHSSANALISFALISKCTHQQMHSYLLHSWIMHLGPSHSYLMHSLLKPTNALLHTHTLTSLCTPSLGMWLCVIWFRGQLLICPHSDMLTWGLNHHSHISLTIILLQRNYVNSSKTTAEPEVGVGGSCAVSYLVVTTSPNSSLKANAINLPRVNFWYNEKNDKFVPILDFCAPPADQWISPQAKTFDSLKSIPVIK